MEQAHQLSQSDCWFFKGSDGHRVEKEERWRHADDLCTWEPYLISSETPGGFKSNLGSV